MNSGIQNIVISLGAMQGVFVYCFISDTPLTFVEFVRHITVARRIPFDDPQILNYVRVGYVTSQVIILGVYFYVSYKVGDIKFSNTYIRLNIHVTTGQAEE
jgi:hypothetical protein